MFRKNNDREERKKAKEQDKKYVEYRINQVLREIKPQSKAFDMKKFDESFPREKRKINHSEVEFGELMHEYLVLRPDPRFATWFGKRDTKRAEAKKPTLSAITKKIGKTSKAPSGGQAGKKNNYEKELQANLALQDEFNEDEDVDRQRIKEAYKFMDAEDIEGKVKNLYNAIGEGGEFFWKCGDDASKNDVHGGVGGGNSESEKEKEKEPEEDEYADSETFTKPSRTVMTTRLCDSAEDPLEKKGALAESRGDDDAAPSRTVMATRLCDSAKEVSESHGDDDAACDSAKEYVNKDPSVVVLLNPFERTIFEPWGPLPQLYNDLKYFNERKLLLGNTLESVVRSNVFTGERKNKATARQVKFHETATAMEYVIESNPLQKSNTIKEPLGNPVRE
ncbi:unnamed protein product [Caenorhabditis auriculariae]|uniref:Uncharacterized protein n=1 Tax=Caenorhabditis auriculariae TaxID=2777116 RepID=A0A8S1H769_9PELO|nr:unnamed protein product [Caenorhabditis auriculariae]